MDLVGIVVLGQEPFLISINIHFRRRRTNWQMWYYSYRVVGLALGTIPSRVPSKFVVGTAIFESPCVPGSVESRCHSTWTAASESRTRGNNVMALLVVFRQIEFFYVSVVEAHVVGVFASDIFS